VNTFKKLYGFDGYFSFVLNCPLNALIKLPRRITISKHSLLYPLCEIAVNRRNGTRPQPKTYKRENGGAFHFNRQNVCFIEGKRSSIVSSIERL